jgi:SAM-dependent methyltransferase
VTTAVPLGAPVFAPPRPEFAAIKARQQATWASGDYAVVGATLTIVPELLCEAMDLRAGEKVLDVACGSGTATLAAARRFCRTTGLDYVPALLSRAAERARADGLEISFLEGDAEMLPFQDGEFDAVLSTFGVMFTPDHQRTASELVRVVRPGGRIGLATGRPMGSWQLFALVGRTAPPPAGMAPPPLGHAALLRGSLRDVVMGTQSRHREFTPLRLACPLHRRVWRYMGRTASAPRSRNGRRPSAELTALIGRFNRSTTERSSFPPDI